MYVWGQDLSGSLQGAGGIGGLVFVRDYTAAKGTYFPGYDGNGNLTAMVSAADGTAAAGYEYSPYGELLTSTGPYANINPFRFSTKYVDSETGLVYFGYRYYNPDTGRWLNRDPIEEKGGANVYGYVRNEPMMHIDPLGQKLKTCCWLCNTTTVSTSEFTSCSTSSEYLEVDFPGSNAERGCRCKLKDKIGIVNNGWGYISDTRLVEAHKGKCCACTMGKLGTATAFREFS